MRGGLITAIGLLVGVFAAVSSARADHPAAPGGADRGAPPAAFLDPGSLTARLHELNAQLGRADSANRAAALAALVSAAQARSRRLAALIEEWPGAVLGAALSARDRALFPAEVRAHLEEEASEEGEYEVLHEDRMPGGRYVYSLHTRRGRLALHFARAVPNLLTGDQVRVRGVRLGQAMAAAGGSGGVTVLAAVSPQSFGEQKTLVIAINFSNAPSAYTAGTVSQMQAVTFGSGASVANYYREASYGETWLTGTVVGPFTIALSSAGCDYYGIANQARQAATASGVNVSSYRRLVYAFPGNGCGWSGLGTVGGSPSQAWLNGNYHNGIVVHELGHNFGLFHSHALECGSVVVGGSCTSIEYGDGLDAMGSAAPYHFNAIQKELLGWLNNGPMPPITTVTANGVYTIDPYEPDGANPKALKVRTPGGDWYYVEYRQPFGFDSSIPASSRTGVVVHLWKNQSMDGVFLLDMTPSTSSWSDPALQVGSTYTDHSAGITIEPLWANATNAGVNVTVSGGGTSCVRNNPTVAVAPATKQGAAGSVQSYTVSITNRDSGCAAATFAGQATKPAGWSAAFTIASLTIAPGATASTTLNVTSSSAATPGNYAIGITAQAAVAPSFASTTVATYGVNAPPGGGTGGFADEFNRADAPSLGPNWAKVVGDLLVVDGAARNAKAKGTHMSVVSGLSGSAQQASARFASLDNNHGPRFGVILRFLDANNYYACYRQTGGVSALRIVRVVNGVETVLARSPVLNPKREVEFALGCQAQGSTLTLTLDGAPRATAVDGTFGSGKVGLLMGYGNGTTGSKSHVADSFTAQAH